MRHLLSAITYVSCILCLSFSLHFRVYGDNTAAIAVFVATAATGHVTHSDANKEEIKQIDRRNTDKSTYQSQYGKTAKSERKPSYGEWVNRNLQNSRVREEYRRAGVISVYNPAEEQRDRG